MDRRAARSSDTDLNSLRSLLLLSPSHREAQRYCSPVQFFAMAIREASVILVYETSNFFNPIHFSEMEMILASDIFLQFSKCNDCNPVQ